MENNMTLWECIAKDLQSVINCQINFKHVASIGGGCINQAWRLIDQAGKNYFVKINQAHLVDMFEAEYHGLNELFATKSIRVPKAIAYGSVLDKSYLILEYINLKGRINPRQAGEKLAQLHQHHHSHFGWSKNNTIGSTLQINSFNNDWVKFWGRHRLGFQLDRAIEKGYSNVAYDKGLKLVDHLSLFFDTYQPKASLLHGDLWSGNIAADTESETVIFDPAVYYGDQETDLAMTELFGGFSNDFYLSYHDTNPIDEGYVIRKTLYNLYHILNHFNLFGRTYARQAEIMTNKLLAEI